ncbi:hypothetical protein ASD8599_03287 [Ascidiaceihabitans donghaensis]|uniref:Uncharacterized protein n=1 Tax=Ascidiaceihabitans donghaensis TaxID=1510460 RepID=A0A2R8BHI7_9RHOB|nr:hypothetical protein [Ascidiaceihabitans donghaensis]SPH22544.1 hypothetical protein ASD8599_03287 [Ascidiaceihabitans donghaensis]
MLISKAAWARISPEDQNIINFMSGMILPQRSAAWDEFDNGHRQIVPDTGLDVSYPDGPLLRYLLVFRQGQDPQHKRKTPPQTGAAFLKILPAYTACAIRPVW